MSYKHAQYMKYDGGSTKNSSNGEATASSTVTAAHVVQVSCVFSGFFSHLTFKTHECVQVFP